MFGTKRRISRNRRIAVDKLMEDPDLLNDVFDGLPDTQTVHSDPEAAMEAAARREEGYGRPAHGFRSLIED